MREAATLAILQKLGFRRGDLHHPAGSEGAPHLNNARRIWIREGPQKQCVHDAVDGGRGANAEGERYYASQGKARLFSKLSERITNILPEALERSLSPSFAGLLLDERNVADGSLSGIPHLFRRQTTLPLRSEE